MNALKCLELDRLSKSGGALSRQECQVRAGLRAIRQPKSIPNQIVIGAKQREDLRLELKNRLHGVGAFGQLPTLNHVMKAKAGFLQKLFGVRMVEDTTDP